MSDLDQAIYNIQRQDEESATKERSTQTKLPYVNLVGYPILPNTLKLINLEDALKYNIVPFLRVEDKLRVAVVDPTPQVVEVIQSMADRLKVEISLSLCSQTSIRYALNIYLLESQKEQKSQSIAVSVEGQKKALREIHSKEELERKLTKASATEILDILFSAATGMEASDIHIEPQEEAIRIRFRIDGVLQEIAFLKPDNYRQILSRVKYLAHMKLDIKKVGQDGRFSIKLGDTTLDVRVATLPSEFGEIIDMRLLRAHAEFIKLDELNLRPDALTAIKEAIALPHGMIIVTGPTGSGKTTTLYAIIDHLNKTGIKIVTLEDPVEYRLPGVDQVQIETEQGFTFVEALRGVLRQDPDIIMVGEIRDKETADIGLQSAMTGHLFLSTLHTNNAPSSLSRLIDMGIEPYKIAGAINLIIAQRLVRKLCINCQGTGCEACHQTGFKGRIPIIEYLKPSRALDDAILRKASVRELHDIAVQGGFIPMYQDGMEKVAQGLTTAEEVTRVTAEVDEQ